MSINPDKFCKSQRFDDFMELVHQVRIHGVGANGLKSLVESVRDDGDVLRSYYFMFCFSWKVKELIDAIDKLDFEFIEILHEKGVCASS